MIIMAVEVLRNHAADRHNRYEVRFDAGLSYADVADV